LPKFGNSATAIRSWGISSVSILVIGVLVIGRLVHAGFGGEKLVGLVDFGNITNCYMIGIEIHLTNSQNQK